jgi:GT2 family glycosyltransferase
VSPIAVVVPVRDGKGFLRAALPALLEALPPGAELVVSDDGSRDGSAAEAAALGARVVGHEHSTGPAAARNRGVRATTGDPIVFLDADVRVGPETLERLLEPFADPGVAAAFGSYDDSPPARSAVSLYRNLAHHFVHQRSRTEASTFWAGCGAVRRAAFEAASGFDESYVRPSIEDVELGYRLRAAGLRIRLVPSARVTHLKRWTLGTWLASDFRDRAMPWARLLRAGRSLPDDLNFTWWDRAASAAMAVGLAALGAIPWLPRMAWLAAAALAFGLLRDVPFFLFAARRVSPAFALATCALQALHRVVGVLGLAAGLLVPARAAGRPGAATGGSAKIAPSTVDGG